MFFFSSPNDRLGVFLYVRILLKTFLIDFHRKHCRCTRDVISCFCSILVVRVWCTVLSKIDEKIIWFLIARTAYDFEHLPFKVSVVGHLNLFMDVACGPNKKSNFTAHTFYWVYTRARQLYGSFVWNGNLFFYRWNSSYRERGRKWLQTRVVNV